MNIESPGMPYNFSDMARNTRLLLQNLKIEKAMVIGHSMGGMLAARFATQYPAIVERLVLYNPIGLVDGRFDRPLESGPRTCQIAMLHEHAPEGKRRPRG